MKFCKTIMSMSHDNGRLARLRLVTWQAVMWEKGLLSLVMEKAVSESQGSTIMFPYVHILVTSVPVRSCKVS